MKNETIGDRIKAAREALRLSQYDLARRLNVDQSTVATWEKGVTAPRVHRLKDLARLLHLTPEFIQFGELEKNAGDLFVELTGVLREFGVIDPINKGRTPRFAIPPSDEDQSPVAVGAILVEGRSHWPSYRDQDVLFYADKRSPSKLVGSECLVETKDGTRLLGILSSVRGRNICTISTFHGPGQPDAHVAWAAPIVWVRRRIHFGA